MQDAKKNPTPSPAALNVDAKASNFKIFYNPEKRRVRLQISAQNCTSSEPTPSIMKKVAARLSKAKASGEISFIKLFDNRLHKVWKELRNASHANKVVTVTLGQGWPVMKGIIVKPTQDHSAIAELSINAPLSEIKNWRLDWLVLEVEQQLAAIGISEPPSPAKLHTMLYNARSGVKVRNAPIPSRNQHIGPQTSTAGYRILHNKVVGEVVLVIYDLKEMQDLNKVKQSLDSIEQRLNGLVASGHPHMRIFKKGIIKTIADAQVGPESLGVDIPLMVLAATRVVGKKAKAKIAAAAAAKAGAMTQTHTAYLAFQIRPDQMQAAISHVNPALFQIPAAKITTAWLNEELKRVGIIYGVKEDAARDTIEKIKAKQPPIGIIIAEGLDPVPGKDPKLIDVTSGLNSFENGNKNFRSYSQQPTVKAGQLVAEIRCQIPSLDGFNILGAAIKVADNLSLPVKVGDGIEQKAQGKFYALTDGIFINDEAGMYLTKSLIHQGDVNFTTGNISFDGPVEIKGNIASGASVFAGGDLTIHGEIRGGHVRCKGNLKIENGIVLGSSGVMRVDGNIDADFIENSTIHCGGVVTVKKSILTSHIIAGTGVEVLNRDGLLAGGSIVTGEFIKTGKLGLPNGAPTEVKTGVNIKAEKILLKHKARLKRLNEKADQERYTLKELTKKGPSHMTKANLDQKISLTKRAPKWKRLLETLQKTVADLASEKGAHNSDAQIHVSDVLAANCSVKLGDKNINVDKEWTNVIISMAEASAGKYIVQQAASSSKKQKKAS